MTVAGPSQTAERLRRAGTKMKFPGRWVRSTLGDASDQETPNRYAGPTLSVRTCPEKEPGGRQPDDEVCSSTRNVRHVDPLLQQSTVEGRGRSSCVPPSRQPIRSPDPGPGIHVPPPRLDRAHRISPSGARPPRSRMLVRRKISSSEPDAAVRRRTVPSRTASTLSRPRSSSGLARDRVANRRPSAMRLRTPATRSGPARNEAPSRGAPRPSAAPPRPAPARRAA